MAKLTSWVDVAPDSDFTIHNIPFGIFSNANNSPRIGVAIGDEILDLVAVAKLGCFDQLKIDKSVFNRPVLNDFIALGKPVTKKIRKEIQKLLSDKKSRIKGKSGILIPRKKAKMHMPVKIGDYTDFYSSVEHATNVGKMFRDPENALLPNWKHIPVGYHGRASSIVIDGTPIHRPKGQVLPKGKERPVFQASNRLDFELEIGFIIGKNSRLGNPVSTDKAEDHIFGLVLFNDWSARDIQKWEYVPLGPFLGKNFASAISPWVVTLEALEEFKVHGPKQTPRVLPYLRFEGAKNYDLNLEVAIKPQGGKETRVSYSNFKYMYWNMCQQLAHHTSNGCDVKIGDIMASGTISGKEDTSFGSMLELAWAGTKPLSLSDGSTRVFINDNDTVTLRGHGKKNGVRVGFGQVSNKIKPAR
ncbi:fumarylacetoacetase [Fulvivirgaceae bacterium BMA12]|uniref:fumarylacetoacetase n=1 Tax=Agaribacillus aureus TaxID=3051825 RepID=A0ABT8LC50_9BACT|nr:fumarylacetoacetase [Fulvivirgaceae bacterium BMA12]